MYSSSRKENRILSLYKAAENGRFEIIDTLYKTEIKNLRKNGFVVQPTHQSNDDVPCKISWNAPFYRGIPAVIQAYILGEIDTFVTKDINFAQELYVIATHTLKSE